MKNSWIIRVAERSGIKSSSNILSDTNNILTIRDGKKHPKLHKYTLRLYIYAVLEYWISEGEQGVI